MVRLVVALVVSTAMCVTSVATGDKKPTPDDPVATELTKAKEDYATAVKAAVEKVLNAFADQQKKLEENKKLKVAEQIKLVEQIQDEKKAFEADSAKLPKSAYMKTAVSDYQTRLDAAKTKCEAAFEKAARSYRDSKDLTSAKAVLAQKARFFDATPGMGRRQMDKQLRIVSVAGYFRDGGLGGQFKIEEANGLIYAEEAFDRKDVICTHPLAPDKPATIDFGTVTRGRTGTLVVRASSDPIFPRTPGGRVVVKVGGKVTHAVEVKKDGKWSVIEVVFDRQGVLIEHHALSWNHEGMFFDYEVK